VADQFVGLHLGEGLDGLLERGVGKRTGVQVVEVDVIKPEAAHAHVGGLAEIPLGAGRTHVGVLGAAAQEAALGGDHEVVRVRVQRLADQLFVGVRPVGVSGVDEGNPGCNHLAKEADALVVVGVLAPDLRTGQLHGSIADRANGKVATDRDGGR
jgi:hypothetical protein